jgi:hypothetical protein
MYVYMCIYNISHNYINMHIVYNIYTPSLYLSLSLFIYICTLGYLGERTA